MCVHGHQCVYMYVLRVHVSVQRGTAFLAQLYLQQDPLHFPSASGPGSVCPLLVSP